MTPEQLAANSAAYWAVLNRVQLQHGVFELYPHHAYQVEPMTANHRRVCVMKGTGMGFSEMEILKSLHGMIHGRYPRGVLYLFPTTDDVGEFSKSRFGPLIAANPLSIGQYVKSGGKGTDTTSLKQVGQAFLYSRGARLTQSIGGGSDSKEASKLRGIQVDKVSFDELDLMPDEALEKALQRMGDSETKDEVYVSNPVFPGFGISRLYDQSDQRHWFRRCGCGHWTCAEESFPDCVRIGEDGRGYIACGKCGKPVPMYAGKGTGQWVRKMTEVRDLAGYQIGHLSSRRHDPADILRKFNDPNNINLADTVRLELGLPYIDKEAQLTVGQVYDCCGAEMMPMHNIGPCGMGVDIGREFHVVIGIRTGRDRFEVLRLVRIPCSAGQVSMKSAWGALHDLARAFNVRSAVVDIRPYEHDAREFRKSEGYRVLLCEYSESGLTDTEVNDDTGVVRAYRTGLCDSTHGLVVDERLKIPRRCPEVDLFAKHVASMSKVLETNKRTGTPIYRYIGPADDHYRHALNYFYLASQGLPVASSYGARPRPRTAICEYQRI